MEGAYERVTKFFDWCLTFDVEPEKWRALSVTIGHPLASAGEFCDNSITTHKYNVLTFVPRSLFEQFRRTANQRVSAASLPERARARSTGRRASVRFVDASVSAGTFC